MQTIQLKLYLPSQLDKQLAISGSNCVPAFCLISFIALSQGRVLRYTSGYFLGLLYITSVSYFVLHIDKFYTNFIFIYSFFMGFLFFSSYALRMMSIDFLYC